MKRRKFIIQYLAETTEEMNSIIRELENQGRTETNGYSIEINSWTYGWFIKLYRRYGE